MLTFASHYVQDPNQTHRLLSLTHNAAASKNLNFQNAFFDYNYLPPHTLIALRPWAPWWTCHLCPVSQGCLGPCPWPFLLLPLCCPTLQTWCLLLSFLFLENELPFPATFWEFYWGISHMLYSSLTWNTQLGGFSIFTDTCNHHHSWFGDIFITSKRNLHTLNLASPILPSIPALSNH